MSNRNLIMTIGEYVKRKETRTYDFTETITPSGETFLTSLRTGERLTREELDRQLPLPLDLMQKYTCESSKKWMRE